MVDGIPVNDIDTLISEWRALFDLCSDFEETHWKRATDLPGWTVQDVLAHIIGTERLLQALPPAPPRSVEAPWVRNPIGDFAENEVSARRERAGAEVLAEWNELRQLREDTLRAGDAAYFAQPMTTPSGPGTMADFLGFRILDCWIHEQDIRRAVDRPGNLAGPAAEHTIERLTRSIPMVVGKRAACPEGAVVALRIDGGVSRALRCQVRGGRAGYVDEPTSDPVCSVSMDTEDFVVLATGRQPVDALAGRVTIGGDVDLGRRIVDNLNVMI